MTPPADNSLPRRVRPAQEAAEILGCRASWLKEQARQRRIPFTMIGGAYGFTDAHIEEIIRIFEQRPDEQVTTGPRRITTAPDTGTGNTIRLVSRRPRRRRAS